MAKKNQFNKNIIYGGLGAVTIAVIFILFSPVSTPPETTGLFEIPFVPEDGDILPKVNVTTIEKCISEEEIILENGKIPSGIIICPPPEAEIIIENITEVVPIIAESITDPFQIFLEEIGFSSIDQFGLVTVVTLEDVAGNNKTFNSILPVVLLSAQKVDDKFLLENTTVQFYGVLKEKQIANINLEGTFNVFINENKIVTKKLFTSQFVSDSNNIPLNIVNVIPPPLGDRPLTYEYEFLDKNFVDGSTNTLRIIVTELKGTYQAGGQSKIIGWTGEFISYELTFSVNEAKVNIVDENGNALSVYKNDSKLIVCGSPSITSTRYVSGTYPFQCSKTKPAIGKLFDIEIFENIGNNVTGTKIGEILKTDDIACQTVEGLSRNHDYIIRINGKELVVSTPLTQHNYNVQFSISGGDPLISSRNGGSFAKGTFVGWECLQTPILQTATSNFGWKYP